MSTMNQRVINNPKFQDLVAKRGRYAWSLSILVLAAFYGFVLLVAFQPALIGAPVSEGSAWTYGVVGGLFIFISFFCFDVRNVNHTHIHTDVANGISFFVVNYKEPISIS